VRALTKPVIRKDLSQCSAYEVFARDSFISKYFWFVHPVIIAPKLHTCLSSEARSVDPVEAAVACDNTLSTTEEI